MGMTSVLNESFLTSTDHIGTFVMPLAVLIDGTAAEEYWFLAGVRDQVRSLGMSLIELPERPSARLGWVTSLDSSSLAGKLVLAFPYSDSCVDSLQNGTA